MPTDYAALVRELETARALLGWIADAAEGKLLDDFALSFPLVRQVADFHQAVETLVRERDMFKGY